MKLKKSVLHEHFKKNYNALVIYFYLPTWPYPNSKHIKWVNIYKYIVYTTQAGADPGILVVGVWIFFSKARALGTALRPSGGGPGGKAPRNLLNFSDFRSKI